MPVVEHSCRRSSNSTSRGIYGGNSTNSSPDSIGGRENCQRTISKDETVPGCSNVDSAVSLRYCYEAKGDGDVECECSLVHVIGRMNYCLESTGSLGGPRNGVCNRCGNLNSTDAGIPERGAAEYCVYKGPLPEKCVDTARNHTCRNKDGGGWRNDRNFGVCGCCACKCSWLSSSNAKHDGYTGDVPSSDVSPSCDCVSDRRCNGYGNSICRCSSSSGDQCSTIGGNFDHGSDKHYYNNGVDNFSRNRRVYFNPSNETSDDVKARAGLGCRSSDCVYRAPGGWQRPLTICMVSDFFFPSLGGVEMHIFELSLRLIRRGLKVIVVTHSANDRHGVRYLTGGLKVYYLPFTCFHDRSTLVTFFSFLPLFRTILIRERVDIVHGHQVTSTMAHECLFHARHLGYRVVYTDHSMFSFADAACIHINKMLKFYLTNVNHCVCVAHTHKENMVLRASLNPHQVAVINNAVDVPSYVPDISKRPELPHIQILILSRLNYRKGIDLLVDVIPAICFKYPHVYFSIGGDGPKRIILEEMREKHRLHDRVELLGAIGQGRASAFLQRGQIFLNASLTESFCIAIVEAAACGLLVVSTNVGGIPEVLPPNMVLLSPPDPEELVKNVEVAIARIQNDEVDPFSFHNQVLAMYSWEDVAIRTEKVYLSSFFEVPLSTSLRPGLSLRDIPLSDKPPPLPDALAVVKILRNLNNCGPFSGKLFLFVALIEWIFVRILEWFLPGSEIEEAASFPCEALHLLEQKAMEME